MKKKKINLLLAIVTIFVLFFSQIASAALVWDWSFPDENITLSPNETFYIRGTLFNDSTSTENLRVGAYSWWISGGDLSGDDFFGGLYTHTPTSNDPGGLFENDQDTNIAPGNSYAFTIAHFDPIQPINVGTQFSWTVRLYNNYSEPTEGSITKTIHATVVPIPSSLLLLFPGIFLIFNYNRKHV